MENHVFTLNNTGVNHWKTMWISMGKEVEKSGLFKDNIISLILSIFIHTLSTDIPLSIHRVFHMTVYIWYIYIGRNS